MQTVCGGSRRGRKGSSSKEAHGSRTIPCTRSILYTVQSSHYLRLCIFPSTMILYVLSMRRALLDSKVRSATNNQVRKVGSSRHYTSAPLARRSCQQLLFHGHSLHKRYILVGKSMHKSNGGHRIYSSRREWHFSGDHGLVMFKLEGCS